MLSRNIKIIIMILIILAVIFGVKPAVSLIPFEIKGNKDMGFIFQGMFLLSFIIFGIGIWVDGLFLSKRESIFEVLFATVCFAAAMMVLAAVMFAILELLILFWPFGWQTTIAGIAILVVLAIACYDKRPKAKPRSRQRKMNHLRLISRKD